MLLYVVIRKNKPVEPIQFLLGTVLVTSWFRIWMDNFRPCWTRNRTGSFLKFLILIKCRVTGMQGRNQSGSETRGKSGVGAEAEIQLCRIADSPTLKSKYILWSFSKHEGSRCYFLFSDSLKMGTVPQCHDIVDKFCFA